MSEPVEVRSARPDEADTVLQVLCEAFHLDFAAARPLFYADPFFDLSQKRVLRTRADGIVSCLTVIPSSFRIGGALAPVGGIAGVATRPARQRRGYAGALLSATVSALADELGYAVSALFPYSYPYYRRFGWEAASHVAQWTASPEAVPAYAEGTSVRPVCPERDGDREAIHRLHAQATRGRTGAAARDARRWHVIEALAPGREAVVYEGADGVITGYLFYERAQPEDSGPESLRLHEMHGATPEARRGLIGFLARQQAARLEWPAGIADLTAFGLLASLPTRTEPEDSAAHSGPAVTLEPGIMLRLVALPKALALVHRANFAPVLARTNGVLTVRATDPIRPENEQPVRLEASGVAPGAWEDPDWIAADIQTLAQLYTGYLTPGQAASLGHLQASSPAALALAEHLFPARAPYVAPPDQF